MKKLSFLVLSLMAMTLLTSCLNNDDPVNKQTLNFLINSRAIHGDNVVFAQNTSSIEIDGTNMTIQINCGYRNAAGEGLTMKTPVMTMTPASGATYSFNSGSTPFSGVSNLEGYFDLSTYTMWYSFTDGNSDKVYCTTQLIYGYATTVVTNPDNYNHYTHTNSQYRFDFDSNGEKCSLTTNYFAPNLTGSIQADQIQWKDLTVTPTTTGYVITADKAESSLKDYFTITDVRIVLDDQCRAINGSFMCNDLNISVTGSLLSDSPYSY